MAFHVWVLEEALKSVTVGRVFPEDRGTGAVTDCDAAEREKHRPEYYTYVQTQAVAFAWL